MRIPHKTEWTTLCASWFFRINHIPCLHISALTLPFNWNLFPPIISILFICFHSILLRRVFHLDQDALSLLKLTNMFFIKWWIKFKNAKTPYKRGCQQNLFNYHSKQFTNQILSDITNTDGSVLFLQRSLSLHLGINKYMCNSMVKIHWHHLVTFTPGADLLLSSVVKIINSEDIQMTTFPFSFGSLRGGLVLFSYRDSTKKHHANVLIT